MVVLLLVVVAAAMVVVVAVIQTDSKLSKRSLGPDFLMKLRAASMSLRRAPT